jgi:spore maturation protein SpmA
VCRVLIRVSRNGNLVSMLDKIMSPVVDYCHSDLPLERVAGYALVLDLQGNVLHGYGPPVLS